MLSSYILLGLASGSAIASSVLDNSYLLAVHNVTRIPDVRFENVAVRADGQILTTTTTPNASISQIDPLGILPPTILYTIPNVTSAVGITEDRPNFFYAASSDIDLSSAFVAHPQSCYITEIDMRGIAVLPDPRPTRRPFTRIVARLSEAALLNGVAFARPTSDHLLVVDSFRGLIWNVNIKSGAVGVALNDTATKGSALKGPSSTGVNGSKVFNDTMYWTSTGTQSPFKIAIDECGNMLLGETPTLVTQQLTCDDLVLDARGDRLHRGASRCHHKGGSERAEDIIAGTLNSTSSSLAGPTALRLGRMASDRWSLYVTTNGGLRQDVPGTTGLSRIDVGLSVWLRD